MTTIKITISFCGDTNDPIQLRDTIIGHVTEFPEIFGEAFIEIESFGRELYRVDIPLNTAIRVDHGD